MIHETDYLIIGGGFYGCCLALYLRSLGGKITLVEAGDTLLSPRLTRQSSTGAHRVSLSQIRPHGCEISGAAQALYGGLPRGHR